MFFATCALLFGPTVLAAPHIPAADNVILARVPAAESTRALEPLRRRLAVRPDDLTASLALTQGYLEIGRTNADPRFVSYAQATLAPWMALPHPTPAVLTLEASTLQYLHQFDEALALLDRALATEPANGQAWLTKATILQVQGRFQEARQACRPLARIAGQLIALTCLSSVDSLAGRLDASYTALRSVFRDDPRLPTTVRVWIREVLADMAERGGDDRSAEIHLMAALQTSPQDGYVKADYADLLLRQGRNAQVVTLLRTDQQQDNLLLRLAIAGRRLRDAEAERWSADYQARYESARRDGDYTHLREQARFLLEVRGRANEALRLAERNWQVQKEPADVRIYSACAAATGDTGAALDLRHWMQQTGYQDQTLRVEPETPRASARQ